MADMALEVSMTQTAVAGWYTDPPTVMAPVGERLVPGNIVFIHPTASQADAGLGCPVALPVCESHEGGFCYAAYSLDGHLHYHPLHAGVEYQTLAQDMAAFVVEYAPEIRFVEEIWHQVVDVSDIIAMNILVAMRFTQYGKDDGAAFRQWMSDFLRDFASFHDMIEFHASGLRLNWTYENDFPSFMQ